MAEKRPSAPDHLPRRWSRRVSRPSPAAEQKRCSWRLLLPPGLEHEEEEERDQQREDAERLGHREAEDQAGELAVGGGRITDRAGKIMAENQAEADTGSAHADAGKTRADQLAHRGGCCQ